MTLVVLQVIGQLALVTQTGIVEEGDAGNPVAVLQLAVALYLILPAAEVPHEVAPVHEVALVAEEELDVLKLRRHLHHDVLAAAVVRHLRALYAAHP